MENIMRNENTKDKFNKLSAIIRVPTITLVLTITSIIVVLFQIITFFQFRNFCCLYLVRPCCRIILWTFRITFTVHNRG